MRKFFFSVSIFLILACSFPSYSFARGSYGSSHRSSHSSSHSSVRSPRTSTIRHSSSTHSYSHSSHPSKSKCISCARDKNGKIARSSKAKKEFMKETGHPNGWKGHVVDHKVALKHGGKDTPSNMQWQTKEEAKTKDKWE